MNEILQKELLNVIQSVKGGVDAVIQASPELIEQLLRWHLTASIFWAVISLIGLIIGTILIVLAIKLKDSDIVGLCCLFSIISFISGIPLFCINIYNALQIYIAPKIWLLEYIGHIINK